MRRTSPCPSSADSSRMASLRRRRTGPSTSSGGRRIRMVLISLISRGGGEVIANDFGESINVPQTAP